MGDALRLRIYGALLVTALGMYWVGQCHGAAAAADLLVTQQAQTALDAGKSYRALVAKLYGLEQQQAGFAQTWKRRADSLRARAVRVDTVVTADSSVVSLWRATANAEHEAAAQCVAALATCGERARTAETRAQALDTLLDHVLRVKDCHVLWLKCPSRVATGLVGLGLGFAGGLLVPR